MPDLLFDDVRARLLATKAMQEQLAATWHWPEATAEDWEDTIEGLDAARDSAADSLAAEQNARAALKAASSALHTETKLVLGIAKVAFRGEPDKLAGFAPLQARAGSIPQTITTAQGVSSAWQDADPSWTPVPGKTLAAYESLRHGVLGHQGTLASATATTRTAQKSLRARLTTEDKKAKAWYAVATRVFPVGTPEGDALRAAIRTS